MRLRITAPPAGFTLIECAVVCAIVGVLASMALPSLQARTLRSARFDAVDALTRVQVAQEQHRALHGLYATEVSALRGVSPRSAQGRYTLTLASTGPEAYRATASALGQQAADSACAALTLEVSLGFAHNGPSAACWNR